MNADTREILWGRLFGSSEDDSEEEVVDLTALRDDDDEDNGVTSGGDSGLWLDDPLAQPE